MAKCLNVHAGYRCRHSGACCRAGWPIPFDRDEFVSTARLPLAPGGLIPDPHGGAHAASHPDGSCVFLDSGTALCEIHRLGTEAALPVTCRMFPRRVLHDARGTFVSLSHFCPTAAALLFDWRDPVRVVEAPETLTGIGSLDGFDARGEWPPLLRPGVLTDLRSYARWETRGIDLLTRDARPPAAALDSLGAVTAILARWSPGAEDLEAVVDREFSRQQEGPAQPRLTNPASEEDAAVKRWLAARLFGNWIAYQGDGLIAIVDYLHTCLRTFAAERVCDGDPVEAIRRADRRLLHEAD